MATKTTYNEFGSDMIDNRATMNQLDSEEMTRNEWRKYLSICDEVARAAFAYIAKPENDNFAEFRSALHALYGFVGADTKIVSIDGYVVRFIPAVVPYKVVKSKEYKNAEKAIRKFKNAIAWACMVSDANREDPDAKLFPEAASMEDMVEKYFDADDQEHYNLCVPFVKAALEAKNALELKVLTAELERLEAFKDDLGKKPWQCYKDFKDPMTSAGGKAVKHIPASLRKNIEDAMADVLISRNLMTIEQLEKEEAQIVGGKKQQRNASK